MRTSTRRYIRRDQPRRIEVFGAISILVFATASGRLLSPPAPQQMSEQLQRWTKQQADAMQQRLSKILGTGGSESDATDQPEFAGTWRTYKSEGLDEYLDRAMGVGYLKRKIATKASQTQKLYQRGNIVHLEISDRRGTAKYIIRPDGRTHSGKGFMKMPIKQKAKWARDGSLVVEERYSTHLGGEEHGEKCSGDACPMIKSRRSLDKASGMMLVEIERTLLNGDVVKTSTYYAAQAAEEG